MGKGIAETCRGRLCQNKMIQVKPLPEDQVNDRSTAAITICCYTEARWDAICASIRSAQAQDFEDFTVIVIVDYNPPLKQRLTEAFPEVLIIENHEKQGLSGARNTGIRAANTHFIAFLDDDAVAEPHWLSNLCALFDDPDVMGTVGKIIPNFTGSYPAWFPIEFYWVIGCSYRGLPTKRSEVRNLVGGCMCVRSEIFNLVGGFRSEIGRVGTVPLGGEETEFCIRARQARPNKRFIFEPAARIHHEVPPSRTNWRYFLSRCYAEGLSKALISRLVGARDGLSSESSYTRRILPTGVLLGLGDVLFRFDLHGIQRAIAIVTGLAVTVAGFAWGRLHIHQLDLPHPGLSAGDLE